MALTMTFPIGTIRATKVFFRDFFRHASVDLPALILIFINQLKTDRKFIKNRYDRFEKNGTEPYFLSRSGIHEPPGPRTDRSDLVLDFLIFFGPGPIPHLK